MIFRRALIRLTLTYALVQLAVYGAFALAVYLYVVSTFDFDPESTEPGVMSAEQGFATWSRSPSWSSSFRSRAGSWRDPR